MYPADRLRVAPIVSLGRHPTNSNSVVVADLAEDIEMLVHGSEEELRTALFTKGAENRPPLKEVRLNRCPFVAEFQVLSEDNLTRLGFDRAVIEKRARRLQQPALMSKITRLFNEPRPAQVMDEDAALYGGFLDDEDRSRCEDFNRGLVEGDWRDLDYKDKRLPVLASRLKARSFPELLEDDELQHWREFVSAKLNAGDDVPWRTLAQFEAELETAEDAEVRSALEAHAKAVRQTYCL